MGDKIVTRAEAEAMAGKMFDRMDANHDGKLDKADREAREVEHFRKLDTDGNGSISQAEFLAAHAGGPGGKDHSGMQHDRMGHGGKEPGGHGMMGGMMMNRADADKDAVISKAEFTSAHLAHFDKIDANHDGKVTPEERKAAMKAMRGMHHRGGAMGDGPPPPPPPAS